MLHKLSIVVLALALAFPVIGYAKKCQPGMEDDSCPKFLTNGKYGTTGITVKSKPFIDSEIYSVRQLISILKRDDDDPEVAFLKERLERGLERYSKGYVFQFDVTPFKTYQLTADHVSNVDRFVGAEVADYEGKMVKLTQEMVDGTKGAMLQVVESIELPVGNNKVLMIDYKSHSFPTGNPSDGIVWEGTVSGSDTLVTLNISLSNEQVSFNGFTHGKTTYKVVGLINTDYYVVYMTDSEVNIRGPRKGEVDRKAKEEKRAAYRKALQRPLEDKPAILKKLKKHNGGR